MGIPWGTIKSLLIFFGPILLPKAVAFYRSVRAAPRINGLKVCPLPPRLLRTIVVLLTVAAIFLLRTLPILSPENVFHATQSRLQIPTDVLFTRLSALRPNNQLTAADLALRARFASLESRLVYLHLGPSVLATCPFCHPDDPRSYLYYALPDLVTPHLANLALLACATSPLPTGSRAAASFRAPAALAAVALALADVYLVATYNHHGANARATRLADLESFFWAAGARRLAALAALDAGLAALLYLAGTQRAFAAAPSSPAQRVEAAVRALGGVKGRVNAAGVVKNTVLRDEELRGRSSAYWAHEVWLMGEMMEDREVVEGVKDALVNRIDIKGIERDAEAYAKAVLMGAGMATGTAPR